MKVLLIHQMFASPNEPGGTRHYELGRRLVDRGDQFAVVASNLNYKTGRPITSGKRLVTEQNVGGIRIVRTYTYPSLHRGFVWRIASFVSFMLTSIVAAWRAGPVDLVIGTSPPLFQLVSAFLIARLRRCPLIVEIRDLWPEFAIDIGVLKNPILIRLARCLEMFFYRHATHLVVNSPAYKTYLVQTKGVPAPKVTLIANGVDPQMFRPDDDGHRLRTELGVDGQFVVTYAGALGLANDIDTVLRAAARLEHENGIRFLIAGDGKERPRLEGMAKQLALSNTSFIGPRPKSQIPTVLAASDACVATLKDIAMFRTTYPNKVFDYMAAARPILLGIDGVIREVVESADAGIFIPPGDDQALAAAILRLRADRPKARAMGARGRSYVTEHFHRDRQARDFAELLDRLILRGRPHVAQPVATIV
jgi:glycosyltransferase involved in cell wall biosynthesis